jgi:uridine phosphorylase
VYYPITYGETREYQTITNNTTGNGVIVICDGMENNPIIRKGETDTMGWIGLIWLRIGASGGLL